MDEVPLLLFLILLSGFFSGAEIALFSLGPEKIQALKKQAKDDPTKLQKIQRLELLKADPEKLLVTILLGNNVVNTASSALATLMATKFAIDNGFGDNQALVIGVVTGVMTFLLLFFGEITPKSLAHRHALSYSVLVAPLLSVMQFILYPIIWPLSKLMSAVTGDEEKEEGLSEDELKAALEISEKEGKIESDEAKWVEKILEFGEHTVESIMTPRSMIFGIEDNTPILEAIKLNQEQRFSRIPIYHDNLDQVIGIMNMHGILEKSLEKDFTDLKVANIPLKQPFKIPITMKIDTLLHEFQKQKTHMALVYDAHGGLVGLITLEDVLEEIFGEIQDEQDEETFIIKQTGKKQVTVSGETELEQVETFIQERFNGEAPETFPWDTDKENQTVGFLILEQTECFPELNTQIQLTTNAHQFTFKVTDRTDESIEMVEIEFDSN